MRFDGKYESILLRHQEADKGLRRSASSDLGFVAFEGSIPRIGQRTEIYRCFAGESWVCRNKNAHGVNQKRYHRNVLNSVRLWL
jgi:hypothetical protein